MVGQKGRGRLTILKIYFYFNHMYTCVPACGLIHVCADACAVQKVLDPLKAQI